jgi:hypothetical protein
VVDCFDHYVAPNIFRGRGNKANEIFSLLRAPWKITKKQNSLTCLVLVQDCAHSGINNHAKLDVLLIQQIPQPPAQEAHNSQEVEVVGSKL